MIQMLGPFSFRHYCPCTPAGVDLVTVRGCVMSRYHEHGIAGQTSTCPRCDTAWALAGRLDLFGPVISVIVPRLEDGVVKCPDTSSPPRKPHTSTLPSAQAA